MTPSMKKEVASKYYLKEASPFCGAVFIIHKNVCRGHAFLPVTLPLPSNKMASKSKRKRKIAFAEEVDICDKKNKQFEDSQEDLRGDNQRSMN